MTFQIKKDGVALMNARTNNVSIARETLDIIKNKHYTSPNGKTIDLSESLDAALTGTKLYKDDAILVSNIQLFPTIEVINEKTGQAAKRLADKNAVALNFANGCNQGGGFLGGARAQEEDLCRCSGLYPCLKSKPMFYNDNIRTDDRYYTDNIIYSPKVPFFRDDNYTLLEEPFTLSIITAPAPNMYGMKIDEELLYTTIRRRAHKILQVAATNGHKNLILGAWGCGAFCNPPKMVAGIFKEVLKEVPVFEYVCFAVYDTREGQPIYKTFQETFQ